MTSTTMNEQHKKPMINIIRVRERIRQLSSTISEQDAEAFAIVLDESLQEQDTTGFATKGDIRELELKMSIFRKDIILWLGGIMIIGFGSVVGMLVKYLPGVAKLVDAVGK